MKCEEIKDTSKGGFRRVQRFLHFEKAEITEDKSFVTTPAGRFNGTVLWFWKVMRVQ